MPRDMLPPAAPTLEGMIEWLKTKDPNEKYIYTDNYGCLVFQFLEHLGHSVLSVNPTHWFACDLTEIEGRPFPRELNYVAVMTQERTFGAALKRAQALAAMNAEDRTLEMGVCI